PVIRVLQTPALPLGYVAVNGSGRHRACRKIERAMRFELTTFSLARRRSTTELHPQVAEIISHFLVNARTQTRTGDTCIFSAVLYQLSYPGLQMIHPIKRQRF